MAKTIWYVSKYVVPQYAGKVGARGYHILSEMVNLGHECVMFCSDSNHLADAPNLEHSSLQETVGGVTVNWIKTRKYRGANSTGRILSWLGFEWRLFRLPKHSLPKPDVLIVSSLSILSILNGFLLRRQYGCTLVFEIRDIWPLSIQELRGWSRRHPVVLVLGFVEWLGYRYSDVIVGTMPNLREHVADVLGYDRAVGCIPQGFDETLLARNDDLDQSFVDTYIPKGKFILVYAGTIGVANAMDTYFDAARQMQDRKDIHFLVVGDGYLKADYQEKCADLDNVTFAPAVPKPLVQSILRRCDVTYLSSPESQLLRYGQSLNKLIDYMLSAKPVLASYSGFPSMLNEAGCGSFIPAGDVSALCCEIERYQSMSDSERQDLGNSGRSWILRNRKFSDLANEYVKLIEESASVS